MGTNRTIGERRPGDLVRIGEAEEAGAPFVVLRDRDGGQVIRPLPGEGLLIGRGEAADLVIGWDTRVSRAHARVEPVGGEWSVVDDGLSRNGTFVNGARVEGRRRLNDGDVVLVGDTPVLFRDPARARGQDAATEVGRAPALAADVTPAQRRVLVALCRPLKAGNQFNRPATNPEIAADLHLSIEAVKTHMRTLFNAFGLADAPQAEKRLRLAEAALALGLVSEREL
ncbi:MAG: FHA domain-containing protein [Thermoleophilia bacterium]|nr:FHA domain-containing protein [Thermoleophilia bacterium]